MEGVLLLTQHPELANRSCDFCLKIYHNQHGETFENRDGTLMKRDESCPPECQTPKGCPKGTPENPKTLNERNLRCYEHYPECRATGQFPDDPIVRHNAAVIREVEDCADRIREGRWQTS